MKNTLLRLLLAIVSLAMSVGAAAQQFFGDLTYTSTPSAITIIGYKCSGSEVTIPDTIDGLPVTTIGPSAFQYCSSLTSITIPGSVKTISQYAFFICSGLTNITVSSGLTSIGNNAFSYCTNLTGITIPESVTNIGDLAFDHCIGLVAINVDAANAFFSSADGVLFNKSHTAVVQCPGGKGGQYSIPDGVTTIGRSAFSHCFSLTSVTIPESVTNIDDYGFYCCTHLTNGMIPKHVTNIGSHAFDECRSLTDVTLPGSITTIGYQAFHDCTGLTNVTIADGVTSTGDATFCLCRNVANVTIPASITHIGFEAFNNCNSLTNVTIPDSVTTISNGAFANCSSLITITIPGSVTNIGGGQFTDCFSLLGIFFKGNPPQISPFGLGLTIATVYYLPGTHGWGTSLAGRPTLLWNPVIQTSGTGFGVGTEGFAFKVTGTTNIPIVLEASSALVSGAWVQLQSLNLTNGLFAFSDTNWSNYPARLYRIRSP